MQLLTAFLFPMESNLMIMSLLVIPQQFMRLPIDHDIYAPVSACAVMDDSNDETELCL
jgi:hypothetical protein